MIRERFSAWEIPAGAQSIALWQPVDLLPAEGANGLIENALQSDFLFLAGKVGVNELNLLYWNERIRIPMPNFGSRRIHCFNTHQIENNAGLKPRSRASYLDCSP